MSLRLGVDLGATWLRACLAEDGKELWCAFRPAVDWRRAPGALRRLLAENGARRVDELILGGTRLGDKRDRAALSRALRPLARRPRVAADFEIAHLAAFGDGPGLLLVASTGSVAWAVGPRGAARAGGWGPLHGDEGSGFWLGREGARSEAVRRQARLPHPLTLAHAPEPVRATASLAPKVLRAAERGEAARRLRARAASHLAAIAREAARAAGLPRPWPLALHGGLFRDPGLRRETLGRLGRVCLREPRKSAERAAACHRPPLRPPQGIDV